MRPGQGQRVMGTIRQQGTGWLQSEGEVYRKGGWDGRGKRVRAPNGQCDAG